MEEAGGAGAPPGDATAVGGALGGSSSRRASARARAGSLLVGWDWRLGTRGSQQPQVGRRALDGAGAGAAPGGGGRVTALAPRTPRSPPPRADSSPSELSDHHTIGSYSELFAAAVGNVEWLRFCLSDRKEFLADDKGFTAIHLAAQRGRLPCIQVLVEEYNFPVDLPTDDHRTPLHLVVNKDNKTTAVPCIDYLLQKGAAINAVTCNSSTPLHLAASEGMLKCMKVLVQNGADVHARDATGCKPIDYCKIWNHRSCARFLKDAMWKRDKKDFAREMKKLKHLKDELMPMEQNYLIQYQKEQSIRRETDFQKWLHSKKQSQPLVSSTMQEAGAQPCFFDLSKTSGTKGSRRTVEARLQSLLQPKILPKPFKVATICQRPKLWNVSNNPAAFPTTDIRYPQGIRLGVHPDRHREHDFSSYLEVTQDAYGHLSLHTVDGHWVAPMPQLPFKVIVGSLFPKSQPYRMNVPEGLHALSILNLAQKRHVVKDTWIDSVAMNMRETFDEAFLQALQAHQVLLALPPPP
ncbi:ankyrin repeat domain-containing protein 53 [Perognathus longimembris pacificus]|uniref:ankyrin repeat domain-containing protein 53 n=1 Tax=Perognathus longimembris pacificus TaxID=214514 RepID=UPI0020189228|nr:ankyrin repeat domain-containing protein 53 [Perognathus longimembris pacificus]